MSAFKRLTEGQYTPGPWRYEAGTKTIRAVPANYWLATMDSWDGAVDHEANARLIAAAPDMLAVLREVSAWLVCPATDAETVEAIKTAVDSVIDQASRTDEP